MSERPTVMLVDDHDLFRAGLRTLLENEGLQVVGEAASGSQCIPLVEQLRPDIVLMDVRMRDGDGVEATLAVTRAGARVVMLSVSDADADIALALRAGARGYLLKTTSIPELIAGIIAVHEGHACLSPPVAERVIGFLRSGALPSTAPQGDISDREIEVLRLVAQGYDNAQIAAQLSISAKTVKNHVSNIFQKLGVQNRVQAAVYAVRSGIA